MKKRIVSMILVLAMLFGMVPVAALAADSEAGAHPFTDVKEDSWYYDHVVYVWEHGIFNGVTATTFEPESCMTRGMFVTVLGRIAGIDPSEYTKAVFDDVSPAAWFGPYVAWAAEEEITLGVGGNRFAPDDCVTREEIATFLHRFLKVCGYALERSELTYTDSDSISDWAEEAVAVCLGTGLMEGDTDGEFRPQDNINRAEAAAVCQRLREYLLTGDATTTYYKVTFENPADETYAATTLPESTTVESGSLVYTMPLPERDGYVFCGWYYNEALTLLAATTDTVTSHVTLYPKMVERTGSDEEIPAFTLNYVASLDVGTDFTVQVQANSEEQIRDGLSFISSSSFGEEIDYTVTDNGGGIYTLAPVGGLKAGDTYQITATDRDHDPVFDEEGGIVEQDYVLFLYEGEVQPSTVRYYNITVSREEHSNLRVNENVIFLSYDQVSGFSFEDSALYNSDLEGGIAANESSGTFGYAGTDLAVGDVVAIYDGVLDEETMDVDGKVSYVQITGIDGGTCEYIIPSLEDVIFLPQALPIPMDDEATEEVDGAIINEDGTITVYNEYLNFARYADIEELSLDGSTTAQVGDYLVLYAGELTAPTDYSYWLITEIQDGGESAVTTFTVTQTDQVGAVSAYEVYHGDLGITDEAIAALETEAQRQAEESGFAEEAANYLARALLSGEEMAEEFSGYRLEGISVRGGAWYEGGEWSEADGNLEIEAGQIEAGVGSLMVEVGKVDVHVKGSKSLQEITGMRSGIRLELGITFPVQIGTYLLGTGWADCVNLTVSASFVQEVAFAPYASVDVQWDTWFIFPYIDEVVVAAGVNMGTYVGVGGTFTVVSGEDFGTVFPWEEAIKSIDPKYDPSFPNVDSIAKKLESMMNNKTTFLEGYDGNSLVSIYQDLLEKEIDYVQILAIKCPGTPIRIDLCKIVQFRFDLELVISAKMSVTIGMAMETLSVKRYYFTLKLFAGKATSGQCDLQTPYTNVNLYVMGNLGLRVGPRATFTLAALGGIAKKHNLVNVGASVELGSATDLYGIFFYHFRQQGGWVDPESRGVGSLEVRQGIYLDVDFTFGAFLDLVSANLHAIDLTYYFLNTKNEAKILEPKQLSYDRTVYNSDTFFISNQYMRMNTLKVRTGETGTRTLSLSDFDIALSNPYFNYNAANGSITVTDPGDSTEEHCQVRLTYTGSDALFQTDPMVVTINLTWIKTWPRHRVAFYQDSYVVQDEDGSTRWYVYSFYPASWEKWFVEGETVTGTDEVEAPQRAGYDFLGWRYISGPLEGVETMTPLEDIALEGMIMPSGSILIAGRYQARTDTPYTINYYTETTAGTGAYELYKTVTHTGITDSYVIAKGLDILREEDIGEMEGFEVRYDLYPIDESGRIFGYLPVNGDGSGSADIYLDREDVSVYFHTNNPDYEGTSVARINGVYGAPLTVPFDLENVEIPGWTFTGWTDKDGNPVQIPETLPLEEGGGVNVGSTYYSGGTHYFAQWTPSYNYYTVNHYLKNIDGTYDLIKTQVGSNAEPEIGGLTGEYIDLEEYVMEIDGATLSSATCVTADGLETYRIVGSAGENVHNGQTLSIYYDRTYTRVYWEDADGEILQYYYEGQSIQAPEGLNAEEKTGYVLDGWKNVVYGGGEIYRDGEEVTMGQIYMRFEPNYVPADGTKYTVTHVRQSATGGYDSSNEDLVETETLYATTDSTVTAAVKTYDGFVSPEPKEVYIRADGSAAITYKYERESYGVTVDSNGGSETAYARNYFYGMSFNLPAAPTRDGYDFAGWKLTTEGYETLYDAKDYVSGDCLTSMKDLTFVAQWEPMQITYHVEHYLEQLDGTYAWQQTDSPKAAYLSEVTATATDFTGFTFDETVEGTVLSGEIGLDETLTLKLYYTRNSYDAEWYDYDGTSLLTTTQFKYGETVTAPNVTGTREGYTFDSWNTGSATMTASGLSFNAKDHGVWTANTYSVTFDANGGEGTMDDLPMTYGQSAALTANSFTRDGYVFAGWSTEENGDVVYDDQAEVGDLTAENGGSFTLYAQWTAGEGTRYTVRYYLENLAGDGYDTQDEARTGVTESIATATAKSIPGFTYDESAENVTSGTVAGDGSLVLELYYTRNSYTLTLDFGGENLKQAEDGEITAFEVEDHTVSVKYGETLADRLEDITVPVPQPGEIYNETTGEWEKVYVDTVFTDAFAGYTFDSWDGICDTMPAEDLTLTAQWTPIEITVTFFPCQANATGEAFSVTATYGDVITIPADHGFSYEGKFISGWSYGSSGVNDGSHIVEELVLVDGYYSYYGSGYSVSGGNENYGVPAGEVHIAAFWSDEDDKGIITFNSNGGLGTMTDQEVDGSGYYYTPLKQNRFTRDGYRFIGWSTTPDGEVVYYDGDMPMWSSGSITLYALWETIE